jgi:ferredoxin-NADP reductase
VRLGDEELFRCYSMSSAPETDADLTVTVKRVPVGRVSNWLNDHVSEGDTVEASRPADVFCLTGDQRPVVAFCGGSGVTPVISIIKSALATTRRPVRLLCANRDRDAIIFREELADLQRRHPGRLDVRHHLDVDDGYVKAGAIGELVAGALDAAFYICGPQPFMDLVEAALLNLWVNPDRIAVERFDNANQPTHPQDAPGTPAVDAGAGHAAAVPVAVTVIINRKRTDIAYQAGDTLLETARRGGPQAPYSCESGDCATCMAFLHDGSATMRANNALTDDEVAEGWVFTCQAVPEGTTVTVEYESY